jgi:hypothetical protein
MLCSMVIIVSLWLPRVALGLEVDEVRHLLARTSFGGTPAEIAALQPLTYEAAVDRLLNSARQQHWRVSSSYTACCVARTCSVARTSRWHLAGLLCSSSTGSCLSHQSTPSHKTPRGEWSSSI